MDALSNGYIQPFIKQLNSRWPCIRFVRRIDQIHFGDTLSIIAKKGSSCSAVHDIHSDGRSIKSQYLFIWEKRVLIHHWSFTNSLENWYDHPQVWHKKSSTSF